MKTTILSRQQLVTYGACLFLASWGLQLAAILTTNGLDDPRMNWWLAATMLTPSLVTCYFLWMNPALRAKLLWKPSTKLISTTILAVVMPTVMALIVLFIVEYEAWGKSQWFEFAGPDVILSGGPFLLGLGSQNWFVFVLNLFVTGLAFAVLNSFFAAGEEMAWRGLLQGLLIEHFGTWRGIVLLGFVWSMWHLPIQLFGYNYPENPIIGSLIFSPLILIAYSIFMGWLTLYSKSFIPAAIAHGAGNGIQEGIISHIHITVLEWYVYLTRVLAAAIVGIIFAWLLAKKETT